MNKIKKKLKQFALFLSLIGLFSSPSFINPVVAHAEVVTLATSAGSSARSANATVLSNTKHMYAKNLNPSDYDSTGAYFTTTLSGKDYNGGTGYCIWLVRQAGTSGDTGILYLGITGQKVGTGKMNSLTLAQKAMDSYGNRYLGYKPTHQVDTYKTESSSVDVTIPLNTYTGSVDIEIHYTGSSANGKDATRNCSDLKASKAAVVTPTYTLTIYNPSGPDSTSTTITKEEGQTYTLPSSRSASGYTFTGYYSKLGSSWSGDTFTFNGNGSVYCDWDENYSKTITFRVNGGSGSVPPDITFSSASQTSDTTGTRPTRSGYTFKGWSAYSSYSSSNPRVDYNGRESATSTSSWTYAQWCSYTGGSSGSNTLVLYAQWSKDPIPPSVSSSPSNQTYSYGGQATFSASFTGDTPINYQWQYSTNGGSFYDYSDGSGYTTTTLTIPRQYNTSMNGYYFRLKATNSAGTNYSSAARLVANDSSFKPSFSSSLTTVNISEIIYI